MLNKGCKIRLIDSANVPTQIFYDKIKDIVSLLLEACEMQICIVVNVVVSYWGLLGRILANQLHHIGFVS